MATYYLRIGYNVNGGQVQNTSGQSYYYYSSGYTSYTSYTASTTYYYIKSTSTSAAVTGCASATGTYATLYQRVASTTTYPNLLNVATMNIVRTGYHIVGTSAYRTTATGGNVINQDYSSSSTTNPATYARLGGSTTGNKTVTLYVNWLGNSYTINYNANGGSGTTASSSHVYGTAKALTTNGFTRTGYTFAGWSKNNSTTTQVFLVVDEGPYDPDAIGTDGTYLYIRQGSAYYRVTVDGSNSYTSLGNVAPSGVTTWYNTYTDFIFNDNTYYLAHSYNDNTGLDKAFIYRRNAITVDFTNGQSITTITKADGTVPSDGDTITLYAVWTPNTYTMHLWANDGTPTLSGHTSRYSAHDISITTGTSTYSNIGTCSKTGYTFDGWYDLLDSQIWDSSGNYVYSTYTGVWTYGGVFTGNIAAYNYAPLDWTIWAKFTPKTTTLTLDPNGGTINGSTASITKTMTYDSTTNVNLEKPTRTGYTFAGWYYGSTQITDAAGKFIENTGYWGTSERTAYYKLSNENTTIAGSGNPYTVSSTTVDTYIKGLIANNTTIPYIRSSIDNSSWDYLAGQKNIFWFIIDEFGHNTDWLYLNSTIGYGRLDYDGDDNYQLHNSLKKPGWKSTSATLTFTANWTPNTYNVYYHADGGTGTMSSSSYTYGAGQTLSLNNFVRPGYKFVGWSTNANQTRVFYVVDQGPYDPGKMGTDGTYVYLYDSPNYYRVTVDNTNQYTDLGTTVPSGVTKWYLLGERMVLNNKDYWFDHTYSEGSGTDKAYIYTTVDNPTINFTDGEVITTYGTLHLYAIWEPVIYIKQNGVWRICVPQTKVNETWKTPNVAYVKVDGTWKQLY